MIVRSYLADGRVVRWSAPDDGLWAIDAEIAAQAVPPALARGTGIRDPEVFWPQWTMLETICKLLDEPVHLRLRRHGLHRAGSDGITTWTWCQSGIVLTAGTTGGSISSHSTYRVHRCARALIT